MFEFIYSYYSYVLYTENFDFGFNSKSMIKLSTNLSDIIVIIEKKSLNNQQIGWKWNKLLTLCLNFLNMKSWVVEKNNHGNMQQEINKVLQIINLITSTYNSS